MGVALAGWAVGVAAGVAGVEAFVDVEALAEEAIVDVLAPELAVGTAGSASKVT